MKIHESGEDYLECILRLSKTKQQVHAIDIANELTYSRPSVTRALHILKRLGLILVEQNHIVLTKSGEQKAGDILERHSVITEFLIAIGVSKKNAEQDACRMEHDVSAETYLAMARFLNDKVRSPKD